MDDGELTPSQPEQRPEQDEQQTDADEPAPANGEGVPVGESFGAGITDTADVDRSPKEMPESEVQG